MFDRSRSRFSKPVQPVQPEPIVPDGPHTGNGKLPPPAPKESEESGRPDGEPDPGPEESAA